MQGLVVVCLQFGSLSSLWGNVGQVIRHGRTASRQELDEGVEYGAKAVFDRLQEELEGVYWIFPCLKFEWSKKKWLHICMERFFHSLSHFVC